MFDMEVALSQIVALYRLSGGFEHPTPIPIIHLLVQDTRGGSQKPRMASNDYLPVLMGNMDS